MVALGVPDGRMIVPRGLGVAVIQHGIERHLIGNVDGSFVAGVHAQSRRQTAACALAAHHDLAVVDAKLDGMLLHPAEGGMAILKRRRIGCFNGQAIIHAHDHRTVLFHQRQWAGKVGHLCHAGGITAAVDPENARGP